jgi:hypothetical protein
MPSLRTALTIVLLTVASSGCDSHAYWTEVQQYHAAAQDVLIANGICASTQDCHNKNILFAESGEISLGFAQWGGAYINLYETQDAVLVDAIVTKLEELHSRLGKPNVTFTVYSSKHLDSKVMFRKVLIKTR